MGEVDTYTIRGFLHELCITMVKVTQLCFIRTKEEENYVN